MELMTRVVSGLGKRSQGGPAPGAVSATQARPNEVIPLRHLQPVSTDSLDEAVLLRDLMIVLGQWLPAAATARREPTAPC